MDHLEQGWKKFTLSNEENKEILIDEKQLIKESKKGDWSVLGKLHAERFINKEVIPSTMSKIWKTSGSFDFLDVCLNTFNVKFSCQNNKNRVMKGLHGSLILSYSP